MLQLGLGIRCRFAFRLPPVHKRVDQRLRLLTSYVAKRRYQLVELQICAWTTYILNSKITIPKVFDKMIYLGISLADKLEPCQLKV